MALGRAPLLEDGGVALVSGDWRQWSRIQNNGPLPAVWLPGWAEAKESLSLRQQEAGAAVRWLQITSM